MHSIYLPYGCLALAAILTWSFWSFTCCLSSSIWMDSSLTLRSSFRLVDCRTVFSLKGRGRGMSRLLPFLKKLLLGPVLPPRTPRAQPQAPPLGWGGSRADPKNWIDRGHSHFRIPIILSSPYQEKRAPERSSQIAMTEAEDGGGGGAQRRKAQRERERMAHVTSLLSAAVPATPDSGTQAVRGWHWASGSLLSWPTGSSSPCSERGQEASLVCTLLPIAFMVILSTSQGLSLRLPTPPTHLSLQGDFVTLQVLPG